MKRTDFYFDLPAELIAQRPSAVRGQDRLMLLGRTSGAVAHHKMDDLPGLIDDGTLMVFNNSRVRRARLFGVKETTGREVEFMFLNQAAFGEGCVWNTMVKNAKKQKAGMRYQFPDGSVATILDDPQNAGTEFRLLKFDFTITEDWFEKNGHIPLPPYIKREDEASDGERYQNVYADQTGSAACPTAGLHFTQEMLGRLSQKGVERNIRIFRRLCQMKGRRLPSSLGLSLSLAEGARPKSGGFLRRKIVWRLRRGRGGRPHSSGNAGHEHLHVPRLQVQGR